MSHVRLLSLSLSLGALALGCASTSSERPGPVPAPTLEGRAEMMPTAAGAPADAPPAGSEVSEVVLAAMDPTADPCTDFYQYACGNWLATTEIPGDQSRWGRSFSVIAERNREVIREILEEAAESPVPPLADVGRFYGSCLDEERVEAQGVAPLEPWRERIAAIDDRGALFSYLGEAHQGVSDLLFGVDVYPDFDDPSLNIGFFGQGGLGLPERDFYLREDEQSRTLLSAYESHVAAMLGLLGRNETEAASAAAAIVAFETELARLSRPATEMRQYSKLYNRIERDGLEGLAPGLPWGAFFDALGFAEMSTLSVATPEFFEGLEPLLEETPMDTLRDYLEWHLVSWAAPRLSRAFVDEDFDFFSRTLQGQSEQRPRWNRCVRASSGRLGEIGVLADHVSRAFVEREFPGDSKEIALDLVHRVEEAFGTILADVSWMDEETRSRALGKRDALSNKIGYPDEWIGAELGLGEDYFENGLAVDRANRRRELARIGGPVDPGAWRMPPSMVNAYYNPLANEMVFPAGILQPPFFHRDYPAPMNFGGIGAVMGHELTHGFDDQGRQFAADGRLVPWWEPEAVERYEAQAACVVEQYNGFEVQPGLNLDGELTLGENIADLGGVKEAFQAWKAWEADHGAPDSEVRGLTNDELFFVAYGQVWCAKAKPEIERMLVQTDSHSAPEWRVRGPLMNFRAFAETFSCEEGDPMRPAEICEVW